MRERHALLFFALMALFFASSCSYLFEQAPASMLSGFVVNSGSGEPVRGTRVTATGLNSGFVDSAVTNSQGRFQLRVQPDMYQLDLLKTGYSGSRVIGIDAHAPASIEVIQREVLNPRWSISPPEIELEGVEEGAVIEGETPYRVNVTGENDTSSIYVAIGKIPGSAFVTAPRHFFSQTPTTGDQSTDPAAFGARGKTTFNVVVYDANNNRTHLIRNITVIPSGGLVGPASELKAIAVTLGKQIQFFDVSSAAAPNDANVYIQLNWEMSRSATITGYRLYRSFDGQYFEPIADVGPTQLTFKDADPRLAVGRPVFYYVTSFRDGDESEPTNIANTKPLATWDVNLISPADDAQNVELQPTFHWEPTRQVAPHHLYAVIFRDTIFGDDSTWLTPEPPDFLENRTSYKWNEDGRYNGTPWETLQPGRLYEWELVYAIAVDDLANPTAVSVAINSLGLDDERYPIDPIGIGSTDNFTFTTGTR